MSNQFYISYLIVEEKPVKTESASHKRPYYTVQSLIFSKKAKIPFDNIDLNRHSVLWCILLTLLRIAIGILFSPDDFVKTSNTMHKLHYFVRSRLIFCFLVLHLIANNTQVIHSVHNTKVVRHLTRFASFIS